jgi:hypothetical protein
MFVALTRNREFKFPVISKKFPVPLSLDGSLLRAKRSELCSMPCGAVRERGPKSQDFLVKFPVSREMQRESGSLETPPTAIEST